MTLAVYATTEMDRGRSLRQFPEADLFFIGEDVVGLFADYLFGEANKARLVYVIDKELSLLAWC